MDKEDKEQISLLKFNIILTLIYIGSLVFSLLLTYNEEIKKQNKKPIFDSKKEKVYNLDNRILIAILTFGYFYINIKNDLRARKKGQNCKNFDLQVIASILSFISVIIVLYVSYQEYKDRQVNVADIENPGL